MSTGMHTKHSDMIAQRRILVLKLLAEGLCWKEVAQRLQIDKRQVDNDLKALRIANDCKNTLQLVVKKVREGVI